MVKELLSSRINNKLGFQIAIWPRMVLWKLQKNTFGNIGQKING